MDRSYLTMLRHIPVPQEDVDFFSSFPFVSPYLSKKSRYQPVPFLTRHKITPNDTSDLFFSKTINSHDTIPRMLALMRKEDLQHPTPQTTTSVDTPAQGPQDPYFVVFAQLESGVNGYRDTLHGGVLASLFDEALGLCVEGCRETGSPGKSWLLTASLEVNYRSAVTTPCIVLIKTWLERTEGRKWFLKAQLLDQDNSVKAEARTLYISSRNHASL
ncbi:hypothetical protein PV08_09891 [Exophiala spinifera]|uniref:Thioesterase domain-containing protein n=1 Tax=Exophiala spinifera TaxID=91928 RepID=A0A0D2B132_9EURO|nr:uncharacterized protein PV08_09891 [Exophiala spinifera]KIW12613.1 hypothetical protein PV08_09891 [Exophiala spinifera]